MRAVLALSAFSATFGLVVVFMVVFPLLVQGILMIIAGLVAGERHQNHEYEAEHRGSY